MEYSRPNASETPMMMVQQQQQTQATQNEKNGEQKFETSDGNQFHANPTYSELTSSNNASSKGGKATSDGKKSAPASVSTSDPSSVSYPGAPYPGHPPMAAYPQYPPSYNVNMGTYTAPPPGANQSHFPPPPPPTAGHSYPAPPAGAPPGAYPAPWPMAPYPYPPSAVYPPPPHAPHAAPIPGHAPPPQMYPHPVPHPVPHPAHAHSYPPHMPVPYGHPPAHYPPYCAAAPQAVPLSESSDSSNSKGETKAGKTVPSKKDASPKGKTLPKAKVVSAATSKESKESNKTSVKNKRKVPPSSNQAPPKSTTLPKTSNAAAPKTTNGRSNCSPDDIFRPKKPRSTAPKSTTTAAIKSKPSDVTSSTTTKKDDNLTEEERMKQRRNRKNDQSRTRAAKLKVRIAAIRAKQPYERSDEEAATLSLYEERRQRKNGRSRERALDRKKEMEKILSLPQEEWTADMNRFINSNMMAKFRKNEGDRLRRKKIKLSKSQDAGETAVKCAEKKNSAKKREENRGGIIATAKSCSEDTRASSIFMDESDDHTIEPIETNSNNMMKTPLTPIYHDNILSLDNPVDMNTDFSSVFLSPGQGVSNLIRLSPKNSKNSPQSNDYSHTSPKTMTVDESCNAAAIDMNSMLASILTPLNTSNDDFIQRSEKKSPNNQGTGRSVLGVNRNIMLPDIKSKNVKTPSNTTTATKQPIQFIAPQSPLTIPTISNSRSFPGLASPIRTQPLHLPRRRIPLYDYEEDASATTSSSSSYVKWNDRDMDSSIGFSDNVFERNGKAHEQPLASKAIAVSFSTDSGVDAYSSFSNNE